MKNGHLSQWENLLEKRAAARRKKRRPLMKVSGAGVKELQKIIAKGKT